MEKSRPAWLRRLLYYVIACVFDLLVFAEAADLPGEAVSLGVVKTQPSHLRVDDVLYSSSSRRGRKVHCRFVTLEWLVEIELLALTLQSPKLSQKGCIARSKERKEN